MRYEHPIRIGVLAKDREEFQSFTHSLCPLDRDIFISIQSVDDLKGIKLDWFIQLSNCMRNPNYDGRFLAYLKESLKDQNLASRVYFEERRPLAELLRESLFPIPHSAGKVHQSEQNL